VPRKSQTISIEETFLQGRLDVEEIYALRREIYCDLKMRKELEKTLTALSKKVTRNQDGAMVAQLGIGLWMFNRMADAEDVLSRVRTRKGVGYFYARVLLDLGKYQEASDFLEQAISREPESFFLKIEMVEARRCLGDLENAMKMLDRLEQNHLDRADFHFEKGCCLEKQGLYEEAMDEYEKSAVLDPDRPNALFRMALNYDLRGEDEKAVECYERLAKFSPVHTSVLINLGLLYEDGREYDNAIRCYNRVLEAVPNHPRAAMYLHDARASTTMYYDEDKAKLVEKRNQVLNTPLSDFELSVRSRNCLTKMNLHTLGDLVQKTESELLSYKNFGETSLIEIKEILRQKGLRLGMNRAELEPSSPSFDKIWGDIGGETRDVLQKPLSQFELSVRSRRCMEMMHMRTLGELASKSEAELLACKNFGQTSLKELKELLTEQGVEFRKD